MRLYPMEHIHIVPLNDLREHECSVDCWCGPTLADDCPPGTDIHLHNALDGRESYEEGRALQ
jgi:hypothetical protein